MTTKMMRLDQYLVANGIARSRGHAKELIQLGKIGPTNQPLLRPSHLVDSESKILHRVSPNESNQVGRGANKLLQLEESFKFSLENFCQNKIVADVGASTGGFTQVLLSKGASKVICIDVGHGQLSTSLRQDPRVQNFEGINIRHPLPPSLIHNITALVADLSFISLRSVMNSLLELMAPDQQGEMLLLYKPQFEVGPKHLSRGGIVRDLMISRASVKDFIQYCTDSFPLKHLATWPCPVKGKKGNQEFFLNFCLH